MSPGSPTATTSRPGPAPHHWTPPPASRSDTGSPGPGTGGSTTSCTWPPSLRSASAACWRRGQTHYLRKIAEAKTHKEARRCLKRRLSDMVYRQLVADAKTIDQPGAGAEEHDVVDR